MGGERKPFIGGQKGENYRFTLLTDGLIRYEWAPDGVFEDRPSAFAANRQQAQSKATDFQIKDSDKCLEIVTSRFHLTYDKQPFGPDGFFVTVFGYTDHTWRYGEQNDTLGGTARTLDEIDGRIDMGHGVCSRKGFASLDDSTTMLFENDGFIAARRPGPGRVDGYLFAYGHDYRAAVQALYYISGSTPLIPRWVLGNWWSRYYAYTEQSFLEVMDGFRDRNIPLSVAVIDMDWHLVDDPKVIEAGQTGWTGYTWNKKLFPNPPRFLEELHSRGLKVTLNDHPAQGVHSFEDLYSEFAKAMNKDPSKKEPIPFNCTDRDYLNAYLKVLIKSLEKDGCDFMWIDWQQGRHSRLPGVDPLWVLNHFHYQHNGNQHEGHPLIFSRYAGPGSHRYPIGFSGDTVVSWKSLEFQPEFTATASNIGYGWWSHDIGGHMLGIKDDELTTRWVQLGIFSPIMRLHSTKNRWVAKEAWKLPYPHSQVVSDFMRLRHRLIPYIHSMNLRASQKGEPLVQPMYWHYPENEEAYRVPNQFYFGTEMLVAPITTPQDRSLKLSKVKAWLPAGRYVDFFTGVVYDGDREMWLSRPIDQYPVLLKEGSIVPLDQALEPKNGARNPDGLEIVVAVGKDGKFELLEESEEEPKSPWVKTPIHFSHKTGTLHIEPAHVVGKQASHKSTRNWSVRFLGVRKSSHIKVKVDGVEKHLDQSLESNGLLVRVGDVPSSSTITVHITPATTPCPRSMIKSIVDDAQIEYQLKEDTWEIIEKSGFSDLSTVGKLQALRMSDNMRLAISELLMSRITDS